MNLRRSDDGDKTVVHVEGRLDATTAGEFRVLADALVAEKRLDVTLDLALLELIDSTGVAAIVGLYKRTRAIGGAIKIANICAQPQAIFKLLRLDRVFDL
jgi:anti-sigma B factor antagonist